MARIVEMLLEKREEILRVARAHGAHEVRVFGSAARGEADNRSDVDLLVTLDPDVTLLTHAKLERELEALLHRKVDVVSERAASENPRTGAERGHSPVSSDKERLLDIIEAIGNIAKYAGADKKRFFDDECENNLRRVTRKRVTDARMGVFGLAGVSLRRDPRRTARRG